MPGKTTLKIFIASSVEVKEERDECILLINQLNNSHDHLILKPVEWEYNIVHKNYPEYENIQGAINPELKESQLIIFIFYSKLGKYTKQEFDFAQKERKAVFAFFKKGFSPKKDTLDQ